MVKPAATVPNIGAPAAKIWKKFNATFNLYASFAKVFLYEWQNLITWESFSEELLAVGKVKYCGESLLEKHTLWLTD